jgi:hypothetical protein
MKSDRSVVISFVGIICGAVLYYGAEWWAARSVDTGQVAGANIGAGMLGLFGIAVGLISLIFFVVFLIKRW